MKPGSTEYHGMYREFLADLVLVLNLFFLKFATDFHKVEIQSIYEDVEGDEYREDLWDQKLNHLYTKDMQHYPGGLQGFLREFGIGEGHGPRVCFRKHFGSNVESCLGNIGSESR